ncbi:spermatogenesis-associated protein 46 [Mauremys mutica]|uniref:spermatogenesis-associated protein 46 n=1 Tax=Mauremys mutica TaxID=74926 RepID=UPI001D160BCE|nr:spermatogenesis-associated protein 46 [Mauremys mutica]
MSQSQGPGQSSQRLSRAPARTCSLHPSQEGMENFSLLTISGPRLPSCAMKSERELPSPRNTPSLPACVPSDSQNSEPLGRNCTIYRPWFSPYSYFVCMDKVSQREACSFPDTLVAGARDTSQPDELPESICSSSCSLEKARPTESTRRASPGVEARDCITSRDILMASKCQPAPQNGYKCVACCRVFPTLHSLKTHVKCGFKEGFSCQVYYHRLKVLWEKERTARPSNRPAFGSCKTPK